MTISENKRKYEARILKHFLKNMDCHFHPPDGENGPDGWTTINGKRIGLELRSYYIDDIQPNDNKPKKGSLQRKTVAGWNKLWVIIDKQRKSHGMLECVKGFVTLNPDNNPTS